MTREEFNVFCGDLSCTDWVMQWGGADVWKVGGKVFAVGRENDDVWAVTFKAGDIGYEVLSDMPGLRPAPYLASRGMKWIQHYALPGLDDAGLKAHITASYEMAIGALTKKKRTELGLNLPEARG